MVLLQRRVDSRGTGPRLGRSNQYTPISGCPASLSATNAFYPSSSSTGSVSVAIAPGCSWGVSNPNSWISILSGSGGTGGGNLPYIVAANPTAYDRSGTIQIADQILAVTQSGIYTSPSNCNYTVGPNGIGRVPIRDSSTQSLLMRSRVAKWTVLNTNAWITITSSLTNSGIGEVTFSVSQKHFVRRPQRQPQHWRPARHHQPIGRAQYHDVGGGARHRWHSAGLDFR